MLNIQATYVRKLRTLTRVAREEKNWRPRKRWASMEWS